MPTKNRIIFFLLILSLSFPGIASAKKDYYTMDFSLPLVSVEKDGVKMSSDSISGQSGGVFKDDVLTISFIHFPLMYDSIYFSLFNNTEGPVILMWDNASFIDNFGGNHKVTILNVSNAGFINDPHPILLKEGDSQWGPISPLFHDKAKGWKYPVPLLSKVSSSIRADLEKYARKYYDGKNIKIVLPIIINNKRVEYKFIFAIKTRISTLKDVLE